MLHGRLSTNLTSLNYHEAARHRHLNGDQRCGGDAKLGYLSRFGSVTTPSWPTNSVGAWLEGKEPMPEAVALVRGWLKISVSRTGWRSNWKALRHEHGALDLQTLEGRPIFCRDEIQDLRRMNGIGPKEIIEDFMIAANGVTARFSTGRKSPP